MADSSGVEKALADAEKTVGEMAAKLREARDELVRAVRRAPRVNQG